MSEPMLTIRSRHPAACGIPPALSTEAADLYIGYFATSRTGTGSSGSSRAIARRARRASGAGTPAGPARTRCVTDGSTG